MENLSLLRATLSKMLQQKKQRGATQATTRPPQVRGESQVAAIAVAATSQDSDTNLIHKFPDICLSRYPLERSRDGMDPAQDNNSAILEFYHVKNSHGGLYSAQKKQCPYWETVWGSCLVLSRILWHWLRNSEYLDIRDWKPDLIEIGSGIGVSSLAAAKTMRCNRVLVTDLVQDALYVFEKSADLLPSEVSKTTSVETCTLDWNKIEQIPDTAFDIVIGSDILYTRWVVKSVATCVQRTLKPGGVTLVTDPCRLHDDEFVDELESLGLHVTVYLLAEPLMKETENTDMGVGELVRVKRGKLFVICKPDSDATAPTRRSRTKLLHEGLLATLDALDIVKETVVAEE